MDNYGSDAQRLEIISYLCELQFQRLKMQTELFESQLDRDNKWAKKAKLIFGVSMVVACLNVALLIYWLVKVF